MYTVFQIIIAISLFKVNWAQLQNCSLYTNPYTICVKEGEKYVMSNPTELNTTLFLHEIVGINEDENSISIQVTMMSFWWMDSTLKKSPNVDL